MSRITRITLGFLLLTLAISFIAWLAVHKQRAARKSGQVAQEGIPVPAQAPPSLPGEQILQNYGSPSGRPQDDLSMMAHAFSNLTLLIKGEPLRLSANEEFAAAMRGKNPAQLRFLPDSHPAFNGRYQLVDRWQTPLFFHSLGHDRIDIRSAGPDRTLWTEDDIHRHYDGQFLTGPDLNAASLFDEKVPPPAAR